MHIEQFRYNADNLGYLVYSNSKGVAIDAGAVDHILAFAQSKNIRIEYVTNTHFHHDHTSGNRDLLKKTAAQFIDCKRITFDQTLMIDDQPLDVFPTPGHTLDSVTFAADSFLVTGDTLFNGTVGNCFSGDLKLFYQSLVRLMAYPPATKIYAGHDYVRESMKYARIIEPYNLNINRFLEQYSADWVVSTLADELLVNPYIRFNAREMIENLNQRGCVSTSGLERFKAIMDIY